MSLLDPALALSSELELELEPLVVAAVGAEDAARVCRLVVVLDCVAVAAVVPVVLVVAAAGLVCAAGVLSVVV